MGIKEGPKARLEEGNNLSIIFINIWDE